MNNPGQPGQRRSCWFYGCLSLAIVCLLGLCLVLLGGFWAKKSFDKAVQRYTQTQPVPIERVQLAPAELTNVQERVARFARSLDDPQNAQELVLSANDINGLISQDPKYKELAGKIHVTIEGDQIKGQLSMPLDELGFDVFKGRYLNGVATFQVSLTNGQLSLAVQELRAGQEPLPERIVKLLQDRALAQELQKDPEINRSLEKFDSIRVENGRLILRSKGHAP